MKEQIMSAIYIRASDHILSVIIAISLFVAVTGCSQRPTVTSPPPIVTNPPPSAATSISVTNDHPTQTAEMSNAELRPIFIEFCVFLNNTLDSSNKLDVSTCSGVVKTSFGPEAAQFLSPAELETLGGAILNKPGQFDVHTVGGQTRSFQFDHGQVIWEYGFPYNDTPRWRFSTKDTNFNFGAIEAQYSDLPPPQ